MSATHVGEVSPQALWAGAWRRATARFGLAMAMVQGLWPGAQAQGAAVAQSSGGDVQLQVVVHGLHSSFGAVRMALWSGPTGFLRDPSRAVWAGRVVIEAREARMAWRNLPPGRYAVAVYHDENDNGRLDTTWLGAPKEGIGFSNNVRHRFYAPSFAECAFDVDAGTDTKRGQGAALRIAIVY